MSLFGNPTNQASGGTSGGGSLFGNLGSSTSQQASQPGQSSNLFGSVNTSQAPQQSGQGLFGGLGKPPNQTTSSQFGASTQQQKAGTTGGLFGSTTATQPQTSSLFGTQTSQAPQSSLFGNTQSQNPAQSQTAPQQQQQQQQQPLNPISESTSRPAYFDGLLERSKQRTNGAANKTGLGDLPSLQLGLGDISRRAKEIGGSSLGQNKGTDGKAHYLLAASGIAPGAALKDLNDFNTQGHVPSTNEDPSLDTNVEAYVAGLHARTTTIMMEEHLARSARDFDAFLEENVKINWDLQRKRIYEHFGLVQKGSEKSREDSAGLSGGRETGSFGRSRRQARSHSRGGTPSGSRVGGKLGASAMSQSVLGSPTKSGQTHDSLFTDVEEKSAGLGHIEDGYQKEKQAKFADKVQSLNDARIKGQTYPLLREFAAIEQQASVDQTSQILDAYRALIEVVEEKSEITPLSQRGAVKERQYADDYLDEGQNSAKAIKIRTRILNGSRRYLEQHFFQDLERLIKQNPREARLGGVPTVLSKVKAYVNIRSSRKDLNPDAADLQIIDGDFCWVIVFFLLRSGHIKEATEYVTKNAPAFRAIDRNFVTYITSYHSSEDRRLKRDLQERISSEYSQRQRIAPENTIDPYRMACYKIIGRCDLIKRNLDGLPSDVEDWIWLQFSMAREVNRVDESEVFGLQEVRDVIKDIGQRHFGKGGEAAAGFGTFFFLQILGGMYEQAVAFLYPHSYMSAVHFAIALEYYGLLRSSDFTTSETELLTFNTKQLPQINFGRMLGYYTRDFRSYTVTPAVDYLTLICLNSTLPGAAGSSQTSLCHAALRELVLETREFSTLLGDIRADGIRITGAIESRLKLLRLTDSDEFLRTITIQAASVANDNGRTTDAVLLYHLAEDYDNVITIINRALSEAVAIDIGQDPLRLQPLKPRIQTQEENAQALPGSSLSLTTVDDPAELARNMIGLYNRNALYFEKIKPQNRETCGVLLRMSEAKDLVAQQQWAPALDIISSLNILPLSANGSIPVIRTSAQSFSSLAPPITRNIGQLLMWTITCCGKQREILRQGQYEDRTRDQMAEQLLSKAKDCMVFAGLVRYKLTGRVYEMLAKAAGEGGAY